MGNGTNNRIWDLFVVLQKELVESQKIRTQIIGFKITLVSGAFGLMAVNYRDVDAALFVIPAFAAIFFDLLIYGDCFSINRIRKYSREHIEPALKSMGELPERFTAWQEFQFDPKNDQILPYWANIGFTFLPVVIGSIALWHPFRCEWSIPLLAALLILFVLDIILVASHAKRRDVD